MIPGGGSTIAATGGWLGVAITGCASPPWGVAWGLPVLLGPKVVSPGNDRLAVDAARSAGLVGGEDATKAPPGLVAGIGIVPTEDLPLAKPMAWMFPLEIPLKECL